MNTNQAIAQMEYSGTVTSELKNNIRRAKVHIKKIVNGFLAKNQQARPNCQRGNKASVLSQVGQKGVETNRFYLPRVEDNLRQSH